jgi:hypothetical protein
MSGCGGFSGQKVNKLAISPKVAAVNRDSITNFTFSYQTSGDPTVLWSTNGGSVNQAGAYRGPTFDGVFEVTVASQANPSVFDKAIVAVGASNKGTIAPETLSLGVGESFGVTSTFSDVTSQITDWFVTSGEVTRVGDNTATLKAPATAATVTLIARSSENPLLFGKKQVAVNNIEVTVLPDGLGLSPGASQTFTATVNGPRNTSVTWSATGGTITADGLWTAPASTGTYFVTATSVANNKVTGQATVIVR